MAPDSTTSTPGDAALKTEADRLVYLLKFVHLFFDGIETFLQIEPAALEAFLSMADDSDSDSSPTSR